MLEEGAKDNEQFREMSKSHKGFREPELSDVIQ